jgi:hypothetical protein
MAQEARRANTGMRCSPHVRRRVCREAFAVDMTLEA